MAACNDPKPVDTSIDCGKCQELFNDPRELPCGHTFCLACIDANIRLPQDDDEGFPCPLCRRKCFVPDEGAEAFPKSLRAKYFMDKAANPETVPLVHPCSQHQPLQTDLYCKTCNAPVCADCSSVGLHKGHDCVDIHMHAKDCQRTIERVDRSIKERLKMLDEVKTNLLKTKQTIQFDCENAVNLIHQQAAEMQRLVREQEQEMLRRIHAQEQIDLQRMDNERGRLQDEKQSAMDEFCRQVWQQCALAVNNGRLERKRNAALAEEDEGRAQEDSGQAQEDDGRAEEDDGRAEEDDGRAEEDSGQAQEDDGRAKEDGGRAQEDSGQAQEDDGRAQEDSGQAQEDDGRAEEDDGRAEEDDGRAQEDSGQAQEDDGRAKEDGGRAQEDGGQAKEDGGRAQEDSWQAQEDDGRAQEDGGWVQEGRKQEYDRQVL